MLATILLIVASMVRAAAQSPNGAIDPSTGLPVSTPAPQWIDTNWVDPNNVLSNVDFVGLPIIEVARLIQSRFPNELDIILPSIYIVSNTASSTGQSQTIDPKSDYGVTLRLTDSTASETFRAMNLEFEAENRPVRWQLIMNGHMPTAVLHVVPELLPHTSAPASAPPPAPEAKRMVFYVGDLMGNEKSGGMTLQQVRKAVELTYFTVFGKDIKDAEYPDAQLLIVSGTSDDIDFVRQTLEALKQKAESARKEQSVSAESSPPTPEQTAGAAAGSK
ncbi:MAG TPA: hypothetical protein VKJ65_00005 [Phycisphaerae bacterium]|nr:hypothetical protein [Phycisphaerae bacterium]